MAKEAGCNWRSAEDQVRVLLDADLQDDYELAHDLDATLPDEIARVLRHH
ncbi:hypothetical protein ABT095_25520 [Kitasatospora sp. NPDC002227]